METGCTVVENGRVCTQRGHHSGACDNQECTGCLPERASRGRWCLNHHERTSETLARLAQRHDDLEECLPPGETEFSGQSFVTGTSELRSALNFAIADHRKHIRARLSYWVAVHAETQFARLPASHRMMYAQTPHHYTGPGTPTHPMPKATSHWLSVRLGAISQEDYAGQFASEVIAADKRAYGLLFLTGKGDRSVGDCPQDGCRNDQGEPGTVNIAVDLNADIPLSDIATCNNCGHEWPSEEWRPLSRAMKKQEATWLTPRVVADEQGIPVSEVYAYASKYQWRRRTSIKRPGLIAYAAIDVLATFGMAA